jgi:acylphosphatase/Flp pilus assembly pilin Flp
MQKCHSIIVTGKVQDMGFRSVVEHIGRSFGIPGFIFNAKDGSVKILCSGEDSVIDNFTHTIKIRGEESGAKIKGIKELLLPFNIDLPDDFSKVSSDDEIDIGRKLDKGNLLLLGGFENLNTDLNTGLNNVNTDLNTGFNSVNTNLNTGFNNLNKDLNTGLNNVNTNLNTGFNSVNTNLNTGFNSVNTNLNTGFNNITTIMLEQNKRMDEHNTRLEAMQKEHNVGQREHNTRLEAMQKEHNAGQREHNTRLEAILEKLADK